LDLIDNVAKQALTYLREANDTDARSAIQRAAALRTIGDLQTQRGQWADAKTTFALAEQALDFAERMAPGTSELLFERAQVAFWLGNCDYTERKFAAAKIQWQRYLDYAQRLQPLTLVDDTGLLETASAMHNLGTASFGIGELKVAVNYFDQAIAIKEALLSENKNNSVLAFSFARSLSWQSKTQEAAGDLRGAMQSYLNQLALCERFREMSPTVVKWRYEAAVARQWIGVLALQMGDAQSAQGQLAAAEQEFSKLHELEPTQSGWQDALANTRSSLAWANLFSSNLVVAEQQIASARKLFEKPADISVMPINWRRGTATAWYRGAQIAKASGQNENAALLEKRAIEAFEDLIEIDPNDRKSLIALANAVTAEDTLDIAVVRRIQSLLAMLLVRQPDASALDALIRTHILLREFSEATNIRSQLNTMGYHHPDYEAFLIRHQGAMP